MSTLLVASQAPEQAAEQTLVRMPRLVVFLGAGAATALLDLLVLVLGRELLGLPLALAAVVGAAAGAAVNFTLNRRWTFGITGGSVRGESLRYGALVGANLVAAAVAVPLLAAAGLPYPVARVVSLVALLAVNFVVCRTWVFRG